MITISTVKLIRTDGTKLPIKIEPLFYEEDGQTLYTGAYQLHAYLPQDPAAAYLKGNHDQTIDIGIFAHKQDDKYEWAYLGDFLDEDEQSQIARHIQNSEQQ